jgi:hypothetical protein
VSDFTSAAFLRDFAMLLRNSSINSSLFSGERLLKGLWHCRTGGLLGVG